MPKYAQFEPGGPEPHRIVAWLDTDKENPDPLPPSDQLYVLTNDQWDAHLMAWTWGVSRLGIAPYLPLPPIVQSKQLAARLAFKAAALEKRAAALRKKGEFEAAYRLLNP